MITRGCWEISPVREHPAPSGALRRPVAEHDDVLDEAGQGAPSTIRCIETETAFTVSLMRTVREHPAPSGALRPPTRVRDRYHIFSVRGHPAPSGALRPLEQLECLVVDRGGREASTIRCIETCNRMVAGSNPAAVREHPAPSGALRLLHCGFVHVVSCDVRGHPAPSGAFVPLPQKNRSWSSAQVPEGGRGRLTPWWCRVRMPHQYFSGLFLPRSVHTRGSN